MWLELTQDELQGGVSYGALPQGVCEVVQDQKELQERMRVDGGTHRQRASCATPATPTVTVMTRSRHGAWLIGLALGQWSGAYGDIFRRERIYWRGRWTPFVWITRRYPLRRFWRGVWPYPDADNG